MVTLQRILCAVEMRLEDIGVLAYACAMARPFEARVDTLLVRDGHGQPTSRHVQVGLPREHDTGREAELLFAELLASTPGSRLPGVVVGGGLRAIVERSEECAADLIVLGLRRLSETGPEKIAALAAEVSRAAACPVMTVPAAARTDSVSRILLPIDFSTATGCAVEWAAALAQRSSATVHLLHAVGSMALREAPARRGEPMKATLGRARGRLEEIEQRLRAATVSCESSVVERGTTHAILACRAHLDSDLIVMGAHHHGSEEAEPSGMVATIRCRAPVPVLSVATPESEDPFLLADPTLRDLGAGKGQGTSVRQ